MTRPARCATCMILGHRSGVLCWFACAACYAAHGMVLRWLLDLSCAGSKEKLLEWLP